MVEFRCRDYGFECKFTAKGKSDKALTLFGKHTQQKHGIEYSKEALIQFLLRKRQQI